MHELERSTDTLQYLREGCSGGRCARSKDCEVVHPKEPAGHGPVDDSEGMFVCRKAIDRAPDAPPVHRRVGAEPLQSFPVDAASEGAVRTLGVHPGGDADT